MSPFIKENISLWNYLQQTTKPIYLYGMGDGAIKIMEALEIYDIKINGIYASDQFVRGNEFCGFTMTSQSKVFEENEEMITLLCFANQNDFMLEKFYELAKDTKREFYSPDVPVVRGEDEQISLFTLDYYKEHEENFLKVYENLADEQSKLVFENVMNYKISGKINYLKDCTTPVSEIYTDIIKPNQDEYYVDLGGFNGDTVIEFLNYSKNAKKIYVFEPDVKNYTKLQKNVDEYFNQNNLDIPIESYNLGAFDKQDTLYFDIGRGKGGRNGKLAKKGTLEVKVDSVDNIVGDQKVTILKLDVEGAEFKALNGAKNTIINNKPKILLSAYHKNEDLWQLPLQILEMNSNYKMYLRHHPYVPAWETNFYFI